MDQKSRTLRFGLGGRLALTNLGLVAVVLGALILAIGIAVSRSIEHQAEAGLVESTAGVLAMVEASDRDLRRRVQSLSAGFTARLGGTLSVKREPTGPGAAAAPTLMHDGTPVNGNDALVDDFTTATGAVATAFVRSGDDFVRIATSLKNDKGERAVGTRLDPSHPAHAKVRAGETFVGLATLFGRRYMTEYRPLKDAGGNVIGIAFVGLDFSAFLAGVKEGIRNLKVGATGYYFVLDASPGPARGSLVVHPAAEGSNILDATDAHGNTFVRHMLDRKTGVIRYPWTNPSRGETQPRDKITAYVHFAAWDWIIGAGTYVDEYTTEVRRLVGWITALGLAAVFAISGVWFALIQRMVTRPIRRSRDVAERLAAGDLTAEILTRRNDEVGDLLRSMNHIGENLAGVVATVRQRADGVALASAEIAQGNLDLSKRTESQASALEQTSASMEQLGVTVRQNAEQAQTASRLTQDASQVVVECGHMVGRVVATMEEIDRSSRQIAEITGVIDGIAFRTNILALNAAVEAARAGDAGRGFAVVAEEVRGLAQRCLQAAREIRVLIEDSVGKVKQGSALVAEAGGTMERAVGEIGDVAAIMQTIGQASVQQSAGVNQVADAVTHMDQVTQQNAALVEQMAAAAGSLSSQSAELVQSVRAFRVPGEPN